jgi:hypothetical protein
MADYVEIGKEDFIDILDKNGYTWERHDQKGTTELLFKIKTSNNLVSIIIYSSIDGFTLKSRGVGEDAIRLILWNERDNRPIGKGKRIYRVTSKESIAHRINNLIQNLYEQANTITLTDWNYVRAILKETIRKARSSSFPTSLLESLNKIGRLTEGQLAYIVGDTTPKGYPTMESSLIYAGWKYNPEFEDATDELSETALDDTEETETDISTEDLEQSENCPGSGKYSSLISVITNPPDMPLIPTTGYTYPFPFFNPVQSMVHPFRNDDSNIVIGASTSSGKTICAEILMEETLRQNQRVVYLSPLKSLTQEKYEDWKTRFPLDPITILTGDYTLSEEKRNALSSSRIIVMTSEMTDSRTRRMETEKNYWLKEVGLVIVDESHILSTSRGHAVESGIMRFSLINPHARILFLSATMPNVGQLGEWLTLLNGKPTRVIQSTWRPVELNMHYAEYNTDDTYEGVQMAKKGMAISIVKMKPAEKFLIFCHDKGTGNSLVKLLKEEGIEAKFHNADLDMTERLETETLFSKREGGLRVLVSTSTLAWGAVQTGTAIKDTLGNNVPVEELMAGDEILSFNENTNTLEPDRVLSVLPYESKSEYVITLEDGKEVVIDYKHPFYVREKGKLIQKQAHELKEGDDVVTIEEILGIY